MTIDKAEVKEEQRKILGDYIETLRNNKKLGFNQLALKSGVNVRTLNEIIYGKAKRVNPFHLQKIAKALNVDYRDFYRIVEYLEEDDEIEQLKKEIEQLKSNTIIQNNHNNGDMVIGKNEKHYYNSTNDELDLSELDEKDIEDVKKYIEFLKNKKLIKI